MPVAPRTRAGLPVLPRLPAAGWFCCEARAVWDGGFSWRSGGEARLHLGRRGELCGGCVCPTAVRRPGWPPRVLGAARGPRGDTVSPMSPRPAPAPTGDCHHGRRHSVDVQRRGGQRSSRSVRWERACPSVLGTWLSLWELSRVPAVRDRLNTAGSARKDPCPRRVPPTRHSPVALETRSLAAESTKPFAPSAGFVPCFRFPVRRPSSTELRARCLDALSPARLDPLQSGLLAVWPGPLGRTALLLGRSRPSQMPMDVGSWDPHLFQPLCPTRPRLPPPLPFLSIWLLRGPPHTLLSASG